MAQKDWTDEIKQSLVEDYEGRNPTPETTMDIVKALAEEYEKTPNGVRMVLTKAGVYIKKEPAKSAASTNSVDKPKRVNKAEAIDGLKEAIEKVGKEVDSDICDRLTGKAAVYFTSLLDA